MFQVPTHLTEALRFLDCLFNCLSFSIFYKRFWTPTDVFILLHVCSFLTPFHICASLFSPSFPFLYRTFPLSHLYVHFFHRPQLYSSSRLIKHNYLFVCFNFLSVSILPQRQASFTLCTSLPLSHPSVVVIMSIFSTLEWCPPSVIYNKISVFLSIDVQSTMVRCQYLLSSVLSLQLQLKIGRAPSMSRRHNRCIL